MAVEYVPIKIDRYGGKVLELVVRRSLNVKTWRVYARTESYGGDYLIPIAWEVAPGRKCRRIGWKRKRDAIAYLASIRQCSES